MARKTRVVLNRETLHEVDLAMVQGFEAMAAQVVAVAGTPDAAPYGVGLIESGSWISYVDGKKVGGTATKKPKNMKVRGQGVATGVGYGFPAKFNEMGTINQPARPFLTPAVMRVVGDSGIVVGAIRAALARDIGKLQRDVVRRSR